MGCPSSLGPAALLGISGARNPLPMGSPSWGSRIGLATAFCDQAPALPPEPARPLSAEAPSIRRPKTSFWELHSAKGNSPRAANHSPNAPWLRKATQAVFPPRPPRSIEHSWAELPQAPWALLLFWGSPAAETHSPQVLLREEAGLGTGRPSAPRPQPCPLGSSTAQRRCPVAPTAPNELLAAAFCKGKLSSGSKHQPQSTLAEESNASRFRPRHHALHSAKRGWAAPGSLGPAALLGVSGG